MSCHLKKKVNSNFNAILWFSINWHLHSTQKKIVSSVNHKWNSIKNSNRNLFSRKLCFAETRIVRKKINHKIFHFRMNYVQLNWILEEKNRFSLYTSVSHPHKSSHKLDAIAISTLKWITQLIFCVVAYPNKLCLSLNYTFNVYRMFKSHEVAIKYLLIKYALHVSMYIVQLWLNLYSF